MANNHTGIQRYINSQKNQLRDPFQPMVTRASNMPKISRRFSLLININYTNAKSLAAILNDPKLHILSNEGRLRVLNNENAIWVYDHRQNLKQIQRVIHQLDRPKKQILIKARIVNIDNNFVHSLGVFFNTTKANDKGEEFSMDLPFTGSRNNMFNIPIIKLRDNTLLNLQLDALEKEGHAKLISSPELLTLNRQAALIESGEEIPYQEKTGNGDTSVAFKKAVLRLKVTPTLLPNKKILLHLTVNQDKVSALVVNGVPGIRTQQLSTQVLVKNNQTFVLGGIFEQTNAVQREGVPGLRKVPLLGTLFSHKRKVVKRKELLIFVTPRIIGF